MGSRGTRKGDPETAVDVPLLLPASLSVILRKLNDIRSLSKEDDVTLHYVFVEGPVFGNSRHISEQKVIA
jgi:hypothetical protein